MAQEQPACGLLSPRRWERVAGKVEVDLDRFEVLPRDDARRALVRTWFGHGDSRAEGVLDAFVYTWIAFNAWGTCVTEQTEDRLWIDGLSVDRALSTAFTRGTRDRAFGRELATFRALWPMFDVRELHRRGLLVSTSRA